MEGEHFARPRVGIACVGEASDLAGAFVEEWQRLGVRQPFQLGVGVTRGLLFDCREFRPPTVRLGFDDADGLPVCKQDIVGRPNFSLILADSDAKTSVEIESVLVLHMPARLVEPTVDAIASNLLGSLVEVRRHGT